MTQTSSFKTNLKSAFAVVKWELKNSRTPLIIFGILAASFIAVVLILCMAIGVDVSDIDPAAVRNSALVFQLISSYGVFGLTMVFTIIYTAGSYSYLHNKRKIDMYGSLPIGSSTLFVSKTFSAFLFSAVPALFFLGVIAVLSLCFGQLPANETISLYTGVLIGTISCISFYGLLAVCCGTTGYSVVSFIAVCVAYPIAARFVKAIIRAFFFGLPVEAGRNSFLMNALNPLDAYGGEHVIYWLMFSVACIVLSAALCQKRRSERAQNSFAYFIPAHLVKLTVSFIVGILLGVMFGSLNAFGNGLLGFAVGFLLGSVSACAIVHLIYYKSFARVLWANVPFAAMVLLTLAAMGLLSADLIGYNTRVPSVENVESAGYVDLTDYYTFKKGGIYTVVNEAADDFTDPEKIKKVIDLHKSVLKEKSFTSRDKLAAVWEALFTEDFEKLVFTDNGMCLSYRLKNGTTVKRYYRTDWSSSYYDLDEDAIKELRDTKEYRSNYRDAKNVDPDNVTSFEVLGELENRHIIKVKKNDSVSAAKAKQDQLSLLDAIKQDGIESDAQQAGGDVKLRLSMSYVESDQSETVQNLLELIGDYGEKSAVFCVCGDDVNTLKALKDIGILTENGEINTSSPYCVEIVEER
ncbi:MAG: hypothetical protein UH734_06665 [Ruminococcus sp.]|nr:hypothetical protein [Ruminococcus sp.]